MTRGRWALLTGAIVMVAALAVPELTDRSDILTLLFLIFLYISLGQSWNILGGYAGQVNLGHAAFFGLGTLATRYLWLAGTPILLALPVGGLLAVVFALIIGVPTFRLRGAYFAIGTLAIAEALRITVGNLLPAINSLPPLMIAAYDLRLRYYLALGLAAVTVIATYALVNSRLGFGMVAVREDEAAAEACGVGSLRHKLVALSASSFFAGVAGGVFAFYHVSYYYALPFSPSWTFDAVLIAFIGGVGTVLGPIVGATAYIFLREVLAVSLVDVHLIIFGTLFVLVVLLLPGGLVEGLERLARLVRPALSRTGRAPRPRPEELPLRARD